MRLVEPPTGVGDEEVWQLRLYVAGQSPKSLRAMSNLTDLCETHLADRYELTVTDVHEDPAAVAREGVIAVPALIRIVPAPKRRFVGDLADSDRVVAMLDLPAVPDALTGPV